MLIFLDLIGNYTGFFVVKKYCKPETKILVRIKFI